MAQTLKFLYKRPPHQEAQTRGDKLMRATDEEFFALQVPEFMIEQLLAPLHPDESALTALLRANIDEAMLREIAEADHGWKAHECYALLQPILKAGVVAADDFNLREVLDLIRWSEPGDPEWYGDTRRGHWMRLFACTAMVRFAPTRRDLFDGECNTLAQLTSSAMVLGQPVARATASVLAWRFLAYPGDDPDAAFLAFAILLLAAHLERGEDRGQWLKDLATWVEDEESRARNALAPWFSSLPRWDKWLTGLTLFDQREAVWRSLAHRILARPECPHSGAAREPLQLLGELVAEI
jgi:hypothetical protein